MTDPVATAVAALSAISLGELKANAELQTRKDRKYIVPVSMLSSILSSCDLRALEVEDRRSFRYESVYFDTPSRTSYRAAAQKRRRRFKVRTRSYLDTGICRLEVKTRAGRGLNSKTRMGYSIEQRTTLTNRAVDFLSDFELIAPLRRDLEPVITTSYRRSTLFDPEASSRITVDTGLVWRTPDGACAQLTDVAIVETKTGGSPCRVDRRLWEAHHRPTKISKYGTGLAALAPGLPANKWSRVLRHHFDGERAQPALAGMTGAPVPGPS